MPIPITLVITEADAKHRLETWELTHWSLASIPQGLTRNPETMWVECPVKKMMSKDLGRLWEAFTPETMDVWRIKDQVTGEMIIVAEVGWRAVESTDYDDEPSTDSSTEVH